MFFQHDMHADDSSCKLSSNSLLTLRGDVKIRPRLRVVNFEHFIASLIVVLCVSIEKMVKVFMFVAQP